MTYRYNTQSKRVMGDLHSPVSIYLKVRDTFPRSALLESSDYHANQNSISYVALNPIAHVEVNRGVCSTFFPDGTHEQQPLTDSFTISDAMISFTESFEVIGDDRHHCGLFGYTTF